MSKWQAPAPEGQPTHTPKIRVLGVATGSADYHELVARYSGELNHFIAKNQQQVAISGRMQHKVQKAVPGGRMIYQNINGQETITLDVKVEGGEEEVSKEAEEYWRWAIVELVVPDIQGLTTVNLSAFMNPPPNNGKAGIAIAHVEPFDTDKPPLSYAVPDLAPVVEADVQDNSYWGSLRVDLRPYPGGVKFDLYGYIDRYQDGTQPGPNTSASYLAIARRNPITTYTGNLTDHDGVHTAGPWPAVGDLDTGQHAVEYKVAGTPHTTLANFELDWPEVASLTLSAVGSIISLNNFGSYVGGPAPQGPSYGGMSVTWTPGNMPSGFNQGALIGAAGGLFTETTTFGADGLIKKVRGIGAMDAYANASTGFQSTALFGAGPSDAQGNYEIDFFDYTLYWIGNHPTVPVYVYPDRDAPVAFVTLDDGPDATTNRYGSPLKENSYRWDASKKYPARWPMKQLGSVHVPAIDPPTDTSQANHFGMTKLGTVIINPKKGKGGIKFIAA